MACLVPQFKCPSSIDAAFFRPSPSSLHSKTRYFVYFRSHCLLLPASAAVVVDFEHMPILEAQQTSLDASRTFSYTGAIDPPMKINGEVSFERKTLLYDLEANIVAAAADAVALARAAVEVAKDAAKMIETNQLAELERSNIFPPEADMLQHHRLRLTDKEWIDMTNQSDTDTKEPCKDYSSQDITENSGIFNLANLELENPNNKNIENIAVRSGRRTERRVRRLKAAEKAASNVTMEKYGTSSKKRRPSLQEVDFSDPLFYLRGKANSSKLLTPSEEQDLSEGIQDLLRLERLQEEVAERNGSQPTFSQWAAAAGVDQKTLRKRLSHGRFCRDKMITCNIRLVISIAKNYQGVGMSLQDLVQEGCKGLVRSAEKFNASKGFKFSTYAHWWIKQAVRKSISEQSRTIRLPVHMVEATYRVKEATKLLYSENRRHPDNEEVAEVAGLSMKTFEAVMLTPKAPRSLDQKIGINMTLKPSEVIADPDAETSEEILIKQFMKQDLNKALDTLNPREKQVVWWRFGMEDGRMKTLQEIGDMMGVSRERVRQIESCAFRKLKNKKKTKNLKQYINS